MENNIIELTEVGKLELEEELDKRLNIDRERIKQALAEARAQGDLSENADYTAAREEQSANEARITEIQNILKKAKIVDEVYVKVEYVDLKKVMEFKICGSESNPFAGKIANDSPLAIGCKAHKKGDVFTITSESGKDLRIKLIEMK